MSVFGVSAIGGRWDGGCADGCEVPGICAKAAVVSSASVKRLRTSMHLLRLPSQQFLDEISGDVDGAPVADRQRCEAARVLHIEPGAVVGQELNHFVNSGRLWTNMTHRGMHGSLARLIGGVDIAVQFESHLYRLDIGAARRCDQRSCSVLCF